MKQRRPNNKTGKSRQLYKMNFLLLHLEVRVFDVFRVNHNDVVVNVINVIALNEGVIITLSVPLWNTFVAVLVIEKANFRIVALATSAVVHGPSPVFTRNSSVHLAKSAWRAAAGYQTIPQEFDRRRSSNSRIPSHIVP